MEKKQAYYKVTNEEETHRGFTFSEGLNILPEPLGEGNGFHFATLDNIHLYYRYGSYLREVYVPQGAELLVGNDFQSCRSDMIFLGKRYSLRDPETYQILGLDIVKNIHLLRECCEEGRHEMLHHWDRLNYVPPGLCLRRLATQASQKGHIKVLDWLRLLAERLQVPFPFCRDAVVSASKTGAGTVIEWWSLNYEKPNILREQLTSRLPESFGQSETTSIVC